MARVVCRKCGTANSVHLRFCENCDTSLGVEMKPVPVALPRVREGVPASGPAPVLNDNRALPPWVDLERSQAVLQPDVSVALQMRIRNSSTIVDAYSVMAESAPGWLTVDCPEVRMNYGKRYYSTVDLIVSARSRCAGSSPRERVETAMSDPVIARPAICLNMIVRNEAPNVRQALDSVAPYITSWVIVDTGSNDGTQEVIRSHMANLGIQGELHERTWRNFGDNRSEALDLAQGHGDYIWVFDADDMVVGTPDFGRLSADVYKIRFYDNGVSYWVDGLFRDGLRWRYEGVTHECAACDDPFVEERLEGEFYIDPRRLRDFDPQKFTRDRELLLAEVEHNPGDSRAAFYLAQTYFDLGDFANARKWYARRADMGGWDEEVYLAMFRVAESMSQLGAPWPDVQDAFLRAWEFRPTRAEPLHAIAHRYRTDQRYQLGHLFAQRAAEIPFPREEALFVGADVYAWRAVDEQAVCASWIDKHMEALTLSRRMLAGRDVPDEHRKRIAANRDISAMELIDAASAYPEMLAQSLIAGPPDSEVTVSLVAGPDRGAAEQIINSFLRCCVDVPHIGRFLVVDEGLSADDRAILCDRYPFLEFSRFAPVGGEDVRLAQIREEVEGRFWLHLGRGWQFFAPERFVSRLTAVLEAEPDVFQVAINFDDAVKLTGASAPESAVRRAAGAGRYVLTDGVATGPAMFETARLDRAGGVDDTDPNPLAELGRRAAAAGLTTASLDEVLCIAGV